MVAAAAAGIPEAEEARRWHQSAAAEAGGRFFRTSITDQARPRGVNSGDGRISIAPRPTPAVPEPSTWAMTLAGFAGLGWLARMRRRKTSPA